MCFPRWTSSVYETCTHGPGGDVGLGLGEGVNVDSGVRRQSQPRPVVPLMGQDQCQSWLSNGLVGLGLVRLTLFPSQSGEVLVNVKEHSRQINDIQLSRDMTMFVTASKDNTAKVSLGKGSGRAQLTQLSPGSLLLQILPPSPPPFSLQLFDSTTLEHQKTFRTERPVNSAALSPNYDHVRESHLRFLLKPQNASRI